MRYASLLLCALLLAALAGPAHGQRPDSVATDTTGTAHAERKSPTRALLYSAGGTVLLAPVFGVGLVVGPAFGHFYAGNCGQAWTGIGLRAVGGAAAAAGGGLLLSAAVPVSYGVDPSEVEGLVVAGTVIGIAGTALLFGSGIHDIATAWGAATNYNEAHGLQAHVTPTVGPEGEQIGLTLRVRF